LKLTKRQLKRIIKEEKARLLSEVTPAERDEARMLATLDVEKIGAEQGKLQSQADISRHLGELHDAIDRLITVMGPDEVVNELVGIAEEIRMGMV
jgi:hypothetical protein